MATCINLLSKFSALKVGSVGEGRSAWRPPDFSQRTNGVQSTTRGPTVGVPDTPGPAHEEDNACLNSVPLEAFQNRVRREVGHIYI